jgi:hypothetical protein
MSETKREYTANYRKPPLHTRFNKGQSGNPPRSAQEEFAGASGRRTERAGVRHDERRRCKITKGEAVIGQLVNEIRKRQFARDQAADRYDEGHRKEDLRRTVARAAPVHPGRRGGDQRRPRADAASSAARNPRHERENPALAMISLPPA